MTIVKQNNFFNAIEKGKTEEDIKQAYAKYFDISYDTSDRHDLYTPRVLFEFKFDKHFTNLKIRSQVIAQTLYYIRRLKYGGYIDKPIPPTLCLADHSFAILTETINWKEFYDDIDEARAKIFTLLNHPELKLLWRQRRDSFLKEHINPTEFLIDFVLNEKWRKKNE